MLCIDGGTVEIHGQRVRLFGIDAPKAASSVYGPPASDGVADSKAASRWPIGLDALPLACQPRDVDRYGRVVAVCFKGNEDLNRWMVANGWAVAFRRYSLDYVADEERRAGSTFGRAVSRCLGIGGPATTLLGSRILTHQLEFEMRRTSLTHPLQIAAVTVGAELGRIGITFCPGKYDRQAMTGFWDRDLEIDLDAIRDWGAAAVVTLLEPKELTLLRVERLGEGVIRRNIRWFHLPIVDVSVPDENFEQDWTMAGEELRSMLRRRLDVLVHCRGGLGRAGTIAARLLIELGTKPEEAIANVRAVRPGAIETADQEEFVRNICARTKMIVRTPHGLV